MFTFAFATGIENSIPTIRRRPHARGRDGELRPLQALAHGLRPGRRTSASAFLRYGPPMHTHLARRRQRYDWEFRRRDLRRSAAAATSCRSSTSATSACRTGSATSRTRISRACFARYARDVRASASPGSSSTRRSTRCSSAPSSRRAVRLVERAADERPRLRHRAEAPRQGQRAGDAGHPGGAARRHLHPERVVRVLPRRQPRGHRPGRASTTPSASCRSTSTTAGGSIPRCTSTSWTTA